MGRQTTNRIGKNFKQRLESPKKLCFFCFNRVKLKPRMEEE